jgi:hypothetical protein
MSPNLMSVVFSAVMTAAMLVVVAATVAVVVAGVAMLITVAGGAAAVWKARRALRAQTSPCPTTPPGPSSNWPDDGVAFVSLAEMARQRTLDSHPAALAAGTETRLSADELVLDMLRTLAMDSQHMQEATTGCGDTASL